MLSFGNLKVSEILKVLKLKDYNHMDYLWSNHAVNELYVEVIDFLMNE
jgi:hypothetical protein